jgi:ribosomal protein L37AE/L43A
MKYEVACPQCGSNNLAPYGNSLTECFDCGETFDKEANPSQNATDWSVRNDARAKQDRGTTSQDSGS